MWKGMRPVQQLLRMPQKSQRREQQQKQTETITCSIWAAGRQMYGIGRKYGLWKNRGQGCACISKSEEDGYSVSLTAASNLLS